MKAPGWDVVGATSTRRDVIRGAAAAAGGLVLEACAHGDRSAASVPSVPTPPSSGARAGLAGGLSVSGTRLIKDGKPFFVSGFNYWAGPTLAREGNAAGWDQVRRDLDGLQKCGVNTLRVMAATEGPDGEPYRIVPTIQPALGHYDPAGVAGLLRFAGELAGRGLHAIFTLNNFWPWSGGFAQYVAWAGQGPIPYPPPAPKGSWDRFSNFSGSFYKNTAAVEGYDAYLRYLVPQLKDNPMVIWELANEPRGMRNGAAYRRWIAASARLLKSMAPGQLVTTGSEGETPSPLYAGLDLVDDHRSADVDFACFHLWAENWGWVHKGSLERDLPSALERAKGYIRDHVARAAELGKPVLLEELGFPRDGGSYLPAAPATIRDRYFEEIYALVASLMPTTPMCGIMPWAWAGSSRPPRPGEMWRPGDPFVGDPPHEPQGWYSVYDGDAMVNLVARWSPKLVAGGGAS